MNDIINNSVLFKSWFKHNKKKYKLLVTDKIKRKLLDIWEYISLFESTVNKYPLEVAYYKIIYDTLLFSLIEGDPLNISDIDCIKSVNQITPLKELARKEFLKLYDPTNKLRHVERLYDRIKYEAL